MIIDKWGLCLSIGMSSTGEFLGYLNQVYGWVDENLINIITTAVIIGIVLVVYRVIVSEVDRLRKRELLDSNTAFLFRRISKWTAYIILVVLIFNILGIKIDFFLGLWVLAGGTIVGFASMSTIGNALAGLIIMVSRPFKIRDRLYFQEQFVVVEDIDLIYTRMRTLDNVVISVPNQILLETAVANQSAYDVVRRRCTVTVDYSEKPMNIRGILLAAIGKVEEVIDEPEPYVWITDFPNFAMEYTLFYYIADTQRSQMIDSEVREAVVEEFAINGMELSTPNLVRSMK